MTYVYHSHALDEAFLTNAEAELKNAFTGCRTIAVKIHFGEPGNKTAFMPKDVAPVTALLKKLGMDFYLYDSSVSYGGPRGEPDSHKRAALKKGWGGLGEVKTDDDFVEVKKEKMSYEVARPLVDADAVLVISHFKGHVCSGFGGAIKNLSMGALSKRSKSAIHAGGEPVYSGGCTQCKACEVACPLETLKVKDKPVFGTCYGCSDCSYACPVHAIQPKLDYFDTLLAEGATAAKQSFKRSYYITFMKNITKECDCESDPKGIVGPDCGMLASSDPVAIDMAAYDIVKKTAGEDVFLKHNKKSGLQQVKAAEKFGMGSVEYDLVEL